MKFRVESVYDIDAQPVLLARRLENGTISLSDTPRLGGFPIRRFVEQVQRLGPDGRPDPDIFAFVLDDRQDRDRFPIGEIVELQ